MFDRLPVPVTMPLPSRALDANEEGFWACNETSLGAARSSLGWLDIIDNACSSISSIWDEERELMQTMVGWVARRSPGAEGEADVKTGESVALPMEVESFLATDFVF